MTSEIKSINYQTDQSLLPYSTKQVERSLDDASFSCKGYLGLAASVAAVALAALSVSAIGAAAIASLSLWFLFSAAISYLKEGECNSEPNQALDKIHTITTEINTQIASTLLFGYTLAPSYHSARGDINGRPILLIHGYGSYGAAWEYQKNRLVEAGHGPIYSINLGIGSSISTYASQVKDKILEIQKETNTDEISLVGHSRGGLVAAYFTSYLAHSINAKVQDVITIGTPFKGAKSAEYGWGQDALEMRTSSSFLTKLREKILSSKAARFCHIYSSADAVVCKKSASFMENKAKRKKFDNLGHSSLLHSSRVADQIIRWLDKRKPEDKLIGKDLSLEGKKVVVLSCKKMKENMDSIEKVIKHRSLLSSLFHDTVAYRTEQDGLPHMRTWYLDKKDCITWINAHSDINHLLDNGASTAEIRRRLHYMASS